MVGAKCARVKAYRAVTFIHGKPLGDTAAGQISGEGRSSIEVLTRILKMPA